MKETTCLVNTSPREWVRMNQPIRWYREMLGKARVLVIVASSNDKPRINQSITTIERIIDEHNQCVKVMCE